MTKPNADSSKGDRTEKPTVKIEGSQDFWDWAFLVAWFYGYIKITLGFSRAASQPGPWKGAGMGWGRLSNTPGG